MLTWFSNIGKLHYARRKLKSPDPNTRREGAEALAALPQRGAIKTALRALEDPKSSVVAAAIGSLASSKNSSVFKLLTNALRHKSSKMRLGTANALGLRGGLREEERREAFDAISSAMADERDRSAAVAMALALRNTQDSRAFDRLLTALRSRYDQDRLAAATALILFQDSSAFDPLAETLAKSNDAEVMKATTKALASLGNPQAVDIILGRFRNLTSASTGWQGGALYGYENPIVALMPDFRDALQLLKCPEKVDKLVAALQDEDQPVRILAAMALGDSGDPRAEEPIRKLLSSEDEAMRVVAEDGLTRLKTGPKQSDSTDNH